MKLLVAIGVVGLLKNGDVVGAAFVEIAVLLGVHGVDLQAHHAEILPGQPAGFPDIFHVALPPALPGKDQNLLHAAGGNDLHLLLDLLQGELHAADVVVAVEAAVDAVVLAVVGDIQGGEEIDRVAEVLAGLQSGPGRHLLQEGLGGGRQEGLEVLDGAGIVLQGGLHVGGGVGRGVIGLHLAYDLVHHVGVDPLHIGQVSHVVCPGGGVGLQPVLFGLGLGGKVAGAHKKPLFHAAHLNPGGSPSGGPRRRPPG